MVQNFVSHYQESSLNHIKNRQCGLIFASILILKNEPIIL